MTQSSMIKLSIPSRLSQGIEFVETVVSQMKAKGYQENATFAVRLALDEAMANAIRHGNENDIKKQVFIEYAVSDQEVKMKIEDQGPGFDPYQVPDPTLDENLERPCGRGVMLMKAYMTEVHFNTKGNCVTMVKKKGCCLPYSASEG